MEREEDYDDEDSDEEVKYIILYSHLISSISLFHPIIKELKQITT